MSEIHTYVLLSILIFRWKSVSPAPRGDKMSIITKVNWITCCIQTAKKTSHFDKNMLKMEWKHAHSHAWNSGVRRRMKQLQVFWNSHFSVFRMPPSLSLPFYIAIRTTKHYILSGGKMNRRDDGNDGSNNAENNNSEWEEINEETHRTRWWIIKNMKKTKWRKNIESAGTRWLCLAAWVVYSKFWIQRVSTS